MPRGVPNDTRVPNVAPQKTFEPMEETIGQDVPRAMKSTGPAKDALEPALIVPVDRPVDNEKLQMLAFMEMPVEVTIHTTSDKTADQIFEIFNNNQREVFRRGETKTVKRKFVNELATRKLTTFTQERQRGPDGVMFDVQVPSTALRYPFSVLSDPHPRGGDWLRSVLNQA